jgi:tRNA-Thr(GGU) m(6)t(6)A37 methyltransferase TsaA
VNVAASSFEIVPVGVVESLLVDPVGAPRQAVEGAPSAWLAMSPAAADGIGGLAVGDRVTILTWLHLARRDVLVTHPRGDSTRTERGVFGTRSQDRPNPIGLHPATITAIDGLRVQVDQLEAVNGTPIIDLKCAL